MWPSHEVYKKPQLDKMNELKTNNNEINGVSLCKTPPLDEEMLKMPNRVSEALRGHKLLITGGTGFMGKVFVEKVLRKTPDIDCIYMLMRYKKGKDPKERLKDIFDSPLFYLLKQERGADIVDRKVIPVTGDCSQPDLGLSVADRQMLIDNVTVVFHMAATIRFDAPLKQAVLLNARGTKLMIELAKEMKNLKFYAHVSTAYCHLNEPVLYEKTYEPPANPHDIIRCMEWMTDEVAESMTKRILGNLPNTYAYTKALGEGLVNEAMDTLPIVIMRPSVVIPIWREPLPGWTDNINGPTGLLIGAGKGVIRTMYCNSTGYADFLPVDIAVNGMMVASWVWLDQKNYDRRVAHMTSSEEVRISWDGIVELGRHIIETKVPLNGVVWYPGGSLKKRRWQHNLAVIFCHYLPAYFLDMIIYLCGYDPVLVRVQKRISKGFEVFEYYANNQWKFLNTAVNFVRPLLNAREKAEYKIDGSGLDMEDYFTDCVKAARVYILKEMPETLPAARRHMRVMYWVDRIATILFYCLLLWLLSKVSNTVDEGLKFTFRIAERSWDAVTGRTAPVPVLDL